MGITGLIPFLEKASTKINIKDIRGKTVAIDTYCWLHKGAIACADKLARGDSTDVHIKYCLKYVNLLLSYDIKPILVFDGRHLPAKALTEAKRRESRSQAKKRAAELLRLGKTDEARSHLRRCIDITHEMALKLIQECRKRNVDCIVAPYEADAQLAYLNIKNIAHFVITEDSDLVLFGCTRIIFKFDLSGVGLLVESDKLYLSMGCRLDKYDFDKFRLMCILSGCDYIDSLPGIGLAKACKFVLKTEESDVKRALSKIPLYLNIKNLIVTEEYKDNFLKAVATFRHMFVYDPITRKLVRLTDPEENGTDLNLCCNAGEVLDDVTAFQLALGNLDPFTLKKLDDWDPDEHRPTGGTTSSWQQSSISKHPSIWRENYHFRSLMSPSTLERDTVKAKLRKSHSPRNKRVVISNISQSETLIDTEKMNETELLTMYLGQEPPSKKLRSITDQNDTEAQRLNEEASIFQTPTKRNPFRKQQTIASSDTEFSPTENKRISFLKQISPVKRIPNVLNKTLIKEPKQLSKFKRTVIDTEQKVISRFFGSSHIHSVITNEISIAPSIHKSPSKLENSKDSNKDTVDIIGQLKAKYENVQLKAAAIYLSSPEAKLISKGEKTPTKDNNLTINNSAKENEIGVVKMNLEEYAFSSIKSTSENIILSISTEGNDEKLEEIIDLSQDKVFVNNKISLMKKSASQTRSLGLSKRNKPTSKLAPSQSRLSMFGFQKKPQLK